VFKASSFYELLERLWVSIFDTLLRMSNMFKDRRCGGAGGSRAGPQEVLGQGRVAVPG
jgi:hypothetical protein